MSYPFAFFKYYLIALIVERDREGGKEEKTIILINIK